MPPPSASGEQEERFCTGGPDIGSCGQSRRSDNASLRSLTLSEVVARLESTVGQASLLLNDRLRTFQARAKGNALTPQHEREVCAIADGIMAASYHMQKWAFLLQPKGSDKLRRPIRHSPCDRSEEALAMLHVALPRITFSVTEACKGLASHMKAHGDAAEKKLRELGAPSEDLRAVGPHLERLVYRLGSLCSDLRFAPPSRTEGKDLGQVGIVPVAPATLVAVGLLGEDAHIMAAGA